MEPEASGTFSTRSVRFQPSRPRSSKPWKLYGVLIRGVPTYRYQEISQDHLGSRPLEIPFSSKQAADLFSLATWGPIIHFLGFLAAEVAADLKKKPLRETPRVASEGRREGGEEKERGQLRGPDSADRFAASGVVLPTCSESLSASGTGGRADSSLGDRIGARFPAANR